MKTLPEYKNHPILHSASDDELMKLIPCCVHADGAEMFRDDEFFIVNWSSAFGAGGGQHCLVSRYPISITAERQMTLESDPGFELSKLNTSSCCPKIGPWCQEEWVSCPQRTNRRDRVCNS